MSTPPTVFVGDIFDTNSGPVTVVKYEGRHRVTVQFSDGFTRVCHLGNLRRCNVRNPYSLKIHGVGIVGEGEYSRKDKKVYGVWENMLRRCYSEEDQARSKNKSYVGCTVSDDWFNLQTFAKDYLNILGTNISFQLDKDLLFRGNKVYSKETCVAVPQEINCLLTMRTNDRGPYPLGVYFNKREGRFKAQLSTNGGRVSLGYFDAPCAAFNAYKIAKESYIKQQATKWRSQIDPRAYEALMAYEVEITD